MLRSRGASFRSRWLCLVSLGILLLGVPISAPAQARPRRTYWLDGGKPTVGKTIGPAQWTNKRVVPKQARFALRIGDDGRVVAMPPLTTFVVQRVAGDRVWATINGVVGWCPASEVVPFDEGIDYFTDVIRRGARDPYAFTVRAMIWSDVRHDVDRALADLDQAIRLSPENPALYALRGRLYAEKKEYDNAIADYTRFLELVPGVARIYYARAQAYRIKRELDRSIVDYNRALALEPDAPDIVNDRGRAYEAAGEHDKAVVDYSRAIQLRSDWLHIPYNNRGNAYLAKGDRKRAIADFTRAMQLNPTYRNPVSSRAVAHMLGRDASAYQDATDAIRLAGRDNAWAIYAAMTGYFTARLLKDDRRSGPFLDEAAARTKDGKWPSPIVSYLRGHIDADRLLSVASDDGEKTEAHCYIGLQSLVDGQEEAAHAHFRWVKQNGFPEFIESYIATVELERLDGKGDAAPRNPTGGEPAAKRGS